MISKLLIFCTTVLLGYSAPIELATDSTTPLPSTPVIVSVCLVNSTEQPLKVRCKLTHIVAPAHKTRVPRAVQYEEMPPEEPNIEDYESTSEAPTTVNHVVEQEGSGAELPVDEAVPSSTTEETAAKALFETTTETPYETTTTFRSIYTPVRDYTTTSPRGATELPEEFVKEKLNVFEVDSKELIRLLKELLQQRRSSVDGQTTPAPTTTSTEAPTTTTRRLNVFVPRDHPAMPPSTTTEPKEDTDTILIDGKEYSVKDLEEAIIQALLEDSPLAE